MFGHYAGSVQPQNTDQRASEQWHEGGAADATRFVRDVLWLLFGKEIDVPPCVWEFALKAQHMCDRRLLCESWL
ncbi:hypothetical protein KIN20_024102, partial [Parelaphostrongylus tenuis]